MDPPKFSHASLPSFAILALSIPILHIGQPVVQFSETFSSIQASGPSSLHEPGDFIPYFSCVIIFTQPADSIFSSAAAFFTWLICFYSQGRTLRCYRMVCMDYFFSLLTLVNTVLFLFFNLPVPFPLPFHRFPRHLRFLGDLSALPKN